MKPLENIRVMDFTQFLSGPYCTLLLAELGAEIIKIEPPMGELMRIYTMMMPDSNQMLSLLNRNKKAITVNLRKPKSIEMMKKLSTKVDVLIENSPPGMMEKLGLDYETLQKINPRLIYASISGFGKTGPLKGELAFDVIAQAASGMLKLTEQTEKPPRFYIGDIGSGIFAALGIVAALYQRNTTGKGQLVDISLLDVLYGMNIIAQGAPLMSEEQKSRVRDEASKMAIYNTFQAKDGYVTVVAITDSEWRRFTEVINRPDLKQNRKFKNIIKRYRNAKEVEEIVQEWIKSKTVDEAVDILRNKARIPCSPVNETDDLIKDPQLRARGMFQVLKDPKLGNIILPGPIIKLSESKETIITPAPKLGQHNIEIYSDLLGYSREEIEAWKKSGLA